LRKKFANKNKKEREDMMGNEREKMNAKIKDNLNTV
jgi:hypothetical protein